MCAVADSSACKRLAAPKTPCPDSKQVQIRTCDGTVIRPVGQIVPQRLGVQRAAGRLVVEYKIVSQDDSEFSAHHCIDVDLQSVGSSSGRCDTSGARTENDSRDAWLASTASRLSREHQPWLTGISREQLERFLRMLWDGALSPKPEDHSRNTKQPHDGAHRCSSDAGNFAQTSDAAGDVSQASEAAKACSHVQQRPGHVASVPEAAKDETHLQPRARLGSDGLGALADVLSKSPPASKKLAPLPVSPKLPYSSAAIFADVGLADEAEDSLHGHAWQAMRLAPLPPSPNSASHATVTAPPAGCVDDDATALPAEQLGKSLCPPPTTVSSPVPQDLRRGADMQGCPPESDSPVACGTSSSATAPTSPDQTPSSWTKNRPKPISIHSEMPAPVPIIRIVGVESSNMKRVLTCPPVLESMEDEPWSPKLLKSGRRSPKTILMQGHNASSLAPSDGDELGGMRRIHSMYSVPINSWANEEPPTPLSPQSSLGSSPKSGRQRLGSCREVLDSLDECNKRGASLEAPGVNKRGASLEPPNMDGVEKRGASLEPPNLHAVNKRGASLEPPNLDAVNKRVASLEPPPKGDTAAPASESVTEMASPAMCKTPSDRKPETHGSTKSATLTGNPTSSLWERRRQASVRTFADSAESSSSTTASATSASHRGGGTQTARRKDMVVAFSDGESSEEEGSPRCATPPQMWATSGRPVLSHVRSPAKGTPMSAEEAEELRCLFFGRNAKSGDPSLPAEWMQGWCFEPDALVSCPYGLRQAEGGPCGIVAPVQAFLLRRMLLDGVDPSDASPEECHAALLDALSDVLCQCAAQHGATVPLRVVVPCVELLGSGVGASILRGPHGYAVREFADRAALRTAWENPPLSTSYFASSAEDHTCAGVPLFLYSAMATRGAAQIKADADNVDEVSMLGAHGYCTQETVNLLLTGAARSNVFDGDRTLGGGMLLKGTSTQSEVGFLSLFEAYGSLEVGRMLKCPKLPVWVIHAESHYSVAFSSSTDAASQEAVNDTELDVWYYDPLGRQDEEKRITVRVGALSSPPEDDDIESNGMIAKVLRTRWGALAELDWNGSEPIY